MARKKGTPGQSRIAEFISTSEDNVDRSRKRFDAARTTVTNAEIYGTEIHAAEARRAFKDAAEVYADALRTHAALVTDYAKERTS